MAWTHIFETEIDGRRVEGFRYEEGDLKVVTVQKTDYFGDVIKDDSSITIAAPILAGEKIEIHAPNSNELHQELIIDGEFSEADAVKIIALFD
jgi:hypothetical protein